MKIICITGTPGTGKTTLSKKLAKELNYHYIDVNKIIKKYKLSEGYDRKRKTKIVDVKKLNKKLVQIIIFFKKYNFIDDALLSRAGSTRTLTRLNIKKITLNKKFNKNSLKNIKKYNGIIIDSHLSHYLPKRYVDLVIVTKCDIKELNKRLKRKRFNKNKIKENLQAEIFDVCYNEALERKHKVIAIDTTKSFNISSVAKHLGGLNAVKKD